MASTYSPALRLDLMATGDQSGTWGDTTNTNLGTLLEQAITGVLSVAQGDVANLTLTTTNGASDQARNAVVEITGALTATRNVVVQTAEKLYTIKNSTTGGFSIVVKTSGGTGISVPPGASVDCYSDGTNVVMGQNYWNGQIGGAVYLDAGATVGPVMDLFRDSTSPAASDIMGQVVFNGRDSAGNKQEYASVETVIVDATSTSEDGRLDIYVTKAGTRTVFASMTATATALTGAAAYSFDAPLSIGTVNAFTAGTIELGAASDTTLSRVSAGVVAIEGSTILTASVTATITKGYTVTPTALGDMTNFTVDPSRGNYQYGTNHAAVTITAPASDCAVDLLVTNDATAGAITFSGFTVGSATGSALTTTNTNKFIISIRRINSVATYSIYALQ